MRWVLLLLALVIGGAQSQEPIPSSGNSIEKPKSQPKKNEKSAPKDRGGTEASPVVVKILPTQTTNPPPTENANRQHDYTSAEWWLIYITGTLAAFTLGLMLYTARLWGATVKLGEDAQETSERQAREMQESLRIARESAAAALIQANTLMSAERGYAKMSHCQPLNLEDTASSVRFKMEIRNWGRTPIQVNRLLLSTHILDADEPLPKDPPYMMGGDQMATHAFLVSQEPFFFWVNASPGEHFREPIRARQGRASPGNDPAGEPQARPAFLLRESGRRER